MKKILYILLLFSSSVFAQHATLIASQAQFANEVVTPTYETEAQTYFDAIGTLNTTQKDAYNQFVVDTKADAIYTKIKAFYPMVWASAAANKFNAINSADTDAAFRATFSGTLTHTATGTTSNGTTGYANIHFNPITEASSLTSFGMGVYKIGTEAGGANRAYMGNRSSGSAETYMGWIGAGTEESITIAGNNDLTPATPQTQKTGFLYGCVNGNRNLQYYVDGVASGSTQTHNGTFASLDIYLFAYNNVSVATGFVSISELSCFIITDGMSATDVGNLNTALQTFIAAL